MSTRFPIIRIRPGGDYGMLFRRGTAFSSVGECVGDGTEQVRRTYYLLKMKDGSMSLPLEEKPWTDFLMLFIPFVMSLFIY